MPRPARRVAPTERQRRAARAVEAGPRCRAGGNAVDAALACALTQGVVDPLMCGIGGLGVMQIFDPVRGSTSFSTGFHLPGRLHRRRCGTLFERVCSDGYGYVLDRRASTIRATCVTTPGSARVRAG